MAGAAPLGSRPAVPKSAPAGKRGGGRDHAWMDDKEFMAAVEQARPRAVPDIFGDIIGMAPSWMNAVAPFYRYHSLDDAFASLVPLSLNKALTFLFLYRGWGYNDFIRFTELSYRVFYRILNNEKNRFNESTLLSIVLPLAPGYVIGKPILMMGRVYSPELSKEIINYLHNCREMAPICIIRALLLHAGVKELLPDKLL